MTSVRTLLARFARPGAGAVARVVIGLIALSVCVALLADIVFNLFRNDEQVAREIRKRVSENVAIQLAVFGVILAWLYERTGMLWAPVLAHAINNTIAFVLLVTDVL